jgi:predicted protein tyrosine phosphatase
MFEVQICNLLESTTLIERWSTKAISIVNFDSWFAKRGTLNNQHLLIQMDDIMQPTITYIEPQSVHISEILEFSKSFNCPAS